jgi:dTDP-4-dehydrorhamnose reductase
VRFLITGAGGQLGLALKRRLSSIPLSHVVALERSALDITSVNSCNNALGLHRPDVVLNCAAYTAVDRAESEPAIAHTINTEGPKNLATACVSHSAQLIHFSTDYVFDGRASRPYLETDSTAPLGVYGSTKLAGENAVLAYDCAPIVLRLSWVYSNDGANFYKTMLRMAAERPTLRVVDDQFGVPNYTADIADAVAAMFVDGVRLAASKAGVYHLSATGVTDWCDFAREIVARANLVQRPLVEAITSEQFPTIAKRPQFSALDSRRFAATFGVPMPVWQTGLDRCLADRCLSA